MNEIWWIVIGICLIGLGVICLVVVQLVTGDGMRRIDQMGDEGGVRKDE